MYTEEYKSTKVFVDNGCLCDAVNENPHLSIRFWDTFLRAFFSFAIPDLTRSALNLWIRNHCHIPGSRREDHAGFT